MDYRLIAHSLWIIIYNISDACATVYDGINQSGSSADLPVGEFNAWLPEINPYNQMPLGDRSESVTVTEGKGFNYFSMLYGITYIILL